MKIFFDTSVLVAAVVDQLPQHTRALEVFANFCESDDEGICSTHCLAECYSTLTALPLPRRIQPHEAWQIIEENFTENLTVLDLKKNSLPQNPQKSEPTRPPQRSHLRRTPPRLR